MSEADVQSAPAPDEDLDYVAGNSNQIEATSGSEGTKKKETRGLSDDLYTFVAPAESVMSEPAENHGEETGTVEETAEPAGTTEEHAENGNGHPEPDIPPEVPVPVQATAEPTKAVGAAAAKSKQAPPAKPGKTNGSAVKKVSTTTCLILMLDVLLYFRS